MSGIIAPVLTIGTNCSVYIHMYIGKGGGPFCVDPGLREWRVPREDIKTCKSINLGLLCEAFSFL